MISKNPLIESKPYQGKCGLIIGMARSGFAAARLLFHAGGKPLLYDKKSPEKINVPEDMRDPKDYAWFLGREIDELYAQADFAIVSPGIPPTSPDVTGARIAGLPITGELEFASQLLPCPVYAVSGTNGKTTMVSLLGDMFTKAGRIAHVAGNVGYPLSMAALNASPDDLVAVEISSFQLETVDRFRPNAAAMLNITPDHLDRHGSMAAYTALKESMFKNMVADDVAVLNADDATVAAMAPNINCRIAWFSAKREVSGGVFVKDGHIVVRWSGKEKTICEVAEVKLPGAHNLGNALAAVMLASVAEVPAPVIRHALRTFAGVEHRIEFVRELNGVRYINDSKGTNSDSTIKAIESMTGPTVLISGGYDKHTSFDLLAAAIKKSPHIEHIVLIGETAERISQALRNENQTAVSFAGNLEEAVLQASRLSRFGSTVLFSPACASFDMFSDYEQRGRVYKDLVAHLG